MIGNHNKEELSSALRSGVDEFDATVLITTESLRCFGCWEEGHVVRLWSVEAVRDVEDSIVDKNILVSVKRKNTETKDTCLGHLSRRSSNRRGGGPLGTSLPSCRGSCPRPMCIILLLAGQASLA